VTYADLAPATFHFDVTYFKSALPKRPRSTLVVSASTSSAMTSTDAMKGITQTSGLDDKSEPSAKCQKSGSSEQIAEFLNWARVEYAPLYSDLFYSTLSSSVSHVVCEARSDFCLCCRFSCRRVTPRCLQAKYAALLAISCSRSPIWMKIYRRRTGTHGAERLWSCAPLSSRQRVLVSLMMTRKCPLLASVPYRCMM